MPQSVISQLATAANDPAVCGALTDRLAQILEGRPFSFMEVCGTHTTAIFQSGLRAVLPHNIEHLSGPGCPVCVTDDTEVAFFLEASRIKNAIIATFGDLARVPGPEGKSLKHLQAEGARIKIIYSPLQAVNLALDQPDKEIVFPAVGFETTAPLVAAAVIYARRNNVRNFSILPFNKLIPPVLRCLLEECGSKIDGFLLPGHVATVIGLEPFQFIAREKPAVVGGFEPAEILSALCALAGQDPHFPKVENAYPLAVDPGGNRKALQIMREVFTTTDAPWRGLGIIAGSGLALRPEFDQFDARKKFDIEPPVFSIARGCRCGDVLKGKIKPVNCPLFGGKCTPAAPVGPCMVSTEGSCAAYYKYGGL